MNIKEQFVKKYKDSALLLEMLTGFPAEILLAQAALETGWGRYVKGNNLYGIKDTKFLKGSQRFKTHEYENGRAKLYELEFEKFSDPTQSMVLYLVLMKSPRYEKAFEAALKRDFETFAKEVQRAGYATDPDYAKKLLAVIKSLPEGWR